MSWLTITISIQTIAGSQSGIDCPNQHSQLGRGKGGEGRGEPTHLRNQIQTDKERVSYSLTRNNKVGKIKGGAFLLSQSNNQNMPINFSSSHLTFSLQKTTAS